MTPQEQILAALKKLGPSSPTALANAIGSEPAACGYHLRSMLGRGELKAEGASNSRVYALPDQKFNAGDAPPRKQKAPKKSGRKKARQTRDPRPAAADDFTAAMTADNRAVLIEAGSVRIYSSERTSAIADLMLAHFTT